MFGSGMCPSDLAKRTTLLISNEQLNDIMKIFKSLEESGLTIKGVSETIQNEAKNKKWISQCVIWYIRCKIIRKRQRYN